MHRDLLENRQWISEAEYKEGLTLAQLMPGRPGIVAFVDGVTAAAVGAIAGAVIVLARRMLFGDSVMPDVT
jgi:chromate transport protein ChrA